MVVKYELTVVTAEDLEDAFKIACMLQHSPCSAALGFNSKPCTVAPETVACAEAFGRP